MKQLKQIFEYQGKIVRTVFVKSDPWFVAKDVCEILEMADVSMTLQRLDDDEKGTSSICTLGGCQEMLTVNEPGLYSLILGSRKPEAKAFKRWITHEVLPSIRKTGQYSLHNNPNAILKRHLVIANQLGRGLSKEKQLEIRRIAVQQASEESGADHSDILKVLETSKPYKPLNPIEAFLTACCTIQPSAEIRKTAIYNSYTDWCKANNEFVLSRIAFNKNLTAFHTGIREYKPSYSSKRVWRGIGLLEAIHDSCSDSK